jgi:hypothetical protein
MRLELRPCPNSKDKIADQLLAAAHNDYLTMMSSSERLGR